MLRSPQDVSGTDCWMSQALTELMIRTNLGSTTRSSFMCSSLVLKRVSSLHATNHTKYAYLELIKDKFFCLRGFTACQSTAM